MCVVNIEKQKYMHFSTKHSFAMYFLCLSYIILYTAFLAAFVLLLTE